MMSVFEKCKYKEHNKGTILTYSFDKIIIMLRGKLIFNFQQNDDKKDTNEDNDQILPEAIRNFRKKLETNQKIESFADLKNQEKNIMSREAFMLMYGRFASGTGPLVASKS